MEEGLTGTENQCLGVAAALGVTPVLKRIGLRGLWRFVLPWLGCERRGSFTGDPLDGPYPDVLIAAGRKAIAAARYIKRQSGGRSFTVFLQNPRVNPACFDLVAVPAHDRLRGANVIVTTGAPNRITPEGLAAARAQWQRAFASLPGPRVAVLVGGNSKTHRMTPAITRQLAEQLSALDAGLMVTASRRTGGENRKILEAYFNCRPGLHGNDRIYFWDGSGANPYQGMLAWADYILVTSDSVSMISDAASTGKPVYMIPLAGRSRKFDRFYARLREEKIVRPFEGRLENWTYSPINDSAEIASEIKKRMI